MINYDYNHIDIAGIKIVNKYMILVLASHITNMEVKNLKYFTKIDVFTSKI